MHISEPRKEPPSPRSTRNHTREASFVIKLQKRGESLASGAQSQNPSLSAVYESRKNMVVTMQGQSIHALLVCSSKAQSRNLSFNPSIHLLFRDYETSPVVPSKPRLVRQPKPSQAYQTSGYTIPPFLRWPAYTAKSEFQSDVCICLLACLAASKAK